MQSTSGKSTAGKNKEIRIPGPDHPITISPAEGKVRVTVAGRIVAESSRALRLEENGYPPVYYLPRNDADISLLVRTSHSTSPTASTDTPSALHKHSHKPTAPESPLATRSSSLRNTA